jgi:hypothetical protein
LYAKDEIEEIGDEAVHTDRLRQGEAREGVRKPFVEGKIHEAEAELSPRRYTHQGGRKPHQVHAWVGGFIDAEGFK